MSDKRNRGCRNRGCPLCGKPVPDVYFDEIEELMKCSGETCCGCGRCFWQVRKEQEESHV